MEDTLNHLLRVTFGQVCGQPMDRTWSLDGEYLPFCHRCTGLYVAAGCDLLVRGWGRARLSWRAHGIHGLLVAQVLVFKLGWVPETGMVRTTSGYALGLGLTGWLGLVRSHGEAAAPAGWRAILLRGVADGLGCGLLWVAVTRGGSATANGLVLVGVMGLVWLIWLSMHQLLAAGKGLFRWLGELATEVQQDLRN